MAKEKWVQNPFKPCSKGKLHKALDVPMGKKIPENKLEKAEHSKNKTLKKEAVLAETSKGFRKK